RRLRRFGPLFAPTSSFVPALLLAFEIGFFHLTERRSIAAVRNSCEELDDEPDMGRDAVRVLGPASCICCISIWYRHSPGNSASRRCCVTRLERGCQTTRHRAHRHPTDPWRDGL